MKFTFLGDLENHICFFNVNYCYLYPHHEYKDQVSRYILSFLKLDSASANHMLVRNGTANQARLAVEKQTTLLFDYDFV